MRSVDLREKVKPLAQYDTLFDLAGAGAASPEIYDIKRRARLVLLLSHANVEI
jgi:hypothetical protein